MRFKRRLLKWLGGVPQIEHELALSWIRGIKREIEDRALCSAEHYQEIHEHLKRLDDIMRRLSLKVALDDIKTINPNGKH